jgi:L-fucose mutarotase
MLKTKLIHPEILSALASSGHGSRVLIADGNYPIVSGSSPESKHVYLNLAPGVVTTIDVLRALVDVIPIEEAAVMMPESGLEPGIFDEFRELLPIEISLKPLGRGEFYRIAQDRNTTLVIATGEQRTFANILLGIGVVAEQY